MRAAWTILAALALPAPAFAQAYQCTVPARIDPLPPVTPDGPTVRVPISGYTLAVSWSPEYCHGQRGKDPGSRIQCGGASGRFGFILHGLWPEAKTGPSPQWCATLPRPTEALIRRNLCTTPVPWLIEHEWAKHGSCMASTPEVYWQNGASLFQALQWPDADRLSRRRDLTVGDLRSEFLLANSGWLRAAVGVLVADNGWLRELRLCYDRRYRPSACPRGSYGPADGKPLKIWRGM